jgi:hemerythrin-like metal-binding protein
MSYINWNDSLSVCIESIDEQHKKLINLINEFYENIKNNSTNDVLSLLIKGMREYTVFHFKNEENLFMLHHYPNYLQHKTEHEDFINKVKDFEDRFNNGKLIVSFEITNFLKSWLKQHIQGTDKQYTEFLIKKGVK